ncbi:hypothetical protein LMG28614_06143 [Paraburkholderia ultramafica]|uniref:ABC transmembrane type-1 domain-containing protein n=1 Tax=Paraburkholderia ultramafica TaxID=1544867 RepID=A0A6S7BLT3_9BURK|nr:ABC transporter permease subunit [Paraburkholderia ultramafica]CAB3805096.1 hypothetical protein LMG28614_06143 [Paraburkholderia ultramafica]
MTQATLSADRSDANANANAGAAAGALRRIGAHLAPWLAPLAILLAWEFAARSGVLSTRVLPEPLAVVKAAWSLIQSGEMWADVKVSTWRAVSGFTIGGGIGLVLGLATGLFKPAEIALDSTVQMVRNIPALAMIPLVILWFGIEEQAKVFLVALGVFFPIYVNTFHGVRSVDANLGRARKARRRRRPARHPHHVSGRASAAVEERAAKRDARPRPQCPRRCARRAR